MSVRSMTGFARVRRVLPDCELVLSIKSVNHRGLDMHFHLPPELDPLEGALRKLIKGKIARGHVQVNLAYTRNRSEGLTLNRPLLEAYLSAFREAVRDYRLEGQPDISQAFLVPGMLRTDVPAEPDAGMEQALVEATQEAVQLLNQFREGEGAAIAAEIEERCATICELVTRMETIRARATPAYQKRLKERLKDLLQGVGIEPQRLAQEAALLADRSDISEELLRLKTHAGQLAKLLKGSGEIGKGLDFLLQEMNREANTVLSKTGGLGELGLTITDLALAAKSEIDKIREQSLNLE